MDNFLTNLTTILAKLLILIIVLVILIFVFGFDISSWLGKTDFTIMDIMIAVGVVTIYLKD